MAGFVYMVKSASGDVGTATGDEARYTDAEVAGFTAGTGFADAFTHDWASKGYADAQSYYYPNIEAALTATTAPAAGDVIRVSDLHDYTNALSADFKYTAPFASTGASYYIYSVDDTDIDAYKEGAKETVTGTSWDLGWGNGTSMSSFGVSYSSGNSIAHVASQTTVFHDCTLYLASTTTFTALAATNDGCHFEFHNVIVNTAYSLARLIFTAGSTLRMYGGSFAGTPTTRISQTGFTGGGASFLFDGTDLSNITTGTLISQAGGSRSADDAMDITIRNCELSSGISGFASEDFDSINQRLTITNSAATSAAAEYQFYIQAFGGEVEDDTSVWRAESRSFPSGKFVSAKVTTTGNVCEGAPFTFELPARWATLSTTDTIRIYLASTTALTKELTWATLIYADGTNNHDANYLTSKPADWMSSGTALETDSTSSWRDGTQPTGDALAGGYNFYYIDLDTSGDAGADSAPLITIHCGEAAATEIFIDTTVDVV